MDDETNESGVDAGAEGTGTTNRVERNYAAELEAANAAVAQRDQTISEHAATIAAKDAEITDWKAKNYDLSLRIPADNPAGDPDPDFDNDGDDGDDGEPYSELFG